MRLEKEEQIQKFKSPSVDEKTRERTKKEIREMVEQETRRRGKGAPGGNFSPGDVYDGADGLFMVRNLSRVYQRFPGNLVDEVLNESLKKK